VVIVWAVVTQVPWDRLGRPAPSHTTATAEPSASASPTS
jgi:hypothetical protein